ncbi:hypothetical protein [Burkholderia anthina]|uniref:hypothetical protein n=1 Tax=Burkholderia anthina TaxID=179879 RepID=UPI0037BF6C11
MQQEQSDSMSRMQLIRTRAAVAANAEDASLWRWFSTLQEERRIRWCFSGQFWYVSVDNRHVATERSFDDSIRIARCEALRRGLAGGEVTVDAQV